MLVPGIMGTKIIIKIDCQELQFNQNEIFSKCGLTDCETKIRIL